MDECIALFFCQLQRISAGIIVNVAVKNDLRAIALCPVDFDQRRRCRHDDHSLCSHKPRRISDALSMVSCGSGNDAPFPFFFRQRTDFVVSAPKLIGSGKLHILRFKINLAAGLL